jgi:uncharacterized protein (DUF2147 family)
MKKTLSACLLALAAGTAWAQATPAGLWKTIDDETKVEKSLVRITDNSGVFTGKVEKILTDKPDAKCTECSDERKGQPVQGMTILRGIKPDANEKGTWVGGDILDPNNGKIYKVLLKLVEGGKKLDVRGYVGMPMLGRTQTWHRVD